MTLQPVPDLTIGSIRLTRLQVRIRFFKGSDADCAALLARMDRYPQRGGG
jgi:hypothetical protein